MIDGNLFANLRKYTKVTEEDLYKLVPPEDHWRLKEGAEWELIIEAYDYLLDKDEELTLTDPIEAAKHYASA